MQAVSREVRCSWVPPPSSRPRAAGSVARAPRGAWARGADPHPPNTKSACTYGCIFMKSQPLQCPFLVRPGDLLLEVGPHRALRRGAEAEPLFSASAAFSAQKSKRVLVFFSNYFSLLFCFYWPCTSSGMDRTGVPQAGARRHPATREKSRSCGIYPTRLRTP